LKYIFIGGAQRSGTTLLQTLLSNSMNNKLILPEAHLICDLLLFYRRGIKDWNKTEYYFNTELKFKKYVKDSIEKILGLISRKHLETNNIVLKDPNFSQFLPEIEDIFPESLFILCVRDPRDIICSFYDIEKRERVLNRQREKYDNRNISFYCDKINNSYKPILSLGKLPLTLRYEDIVMDPYANLNIILDNLNLPSYLSSFNNLKWADEKIRHKDSWISPLEGKKPSAERVGIYKKMLENYEINYVQNKCSKVMKAFF
jgi:hypothetical protein